MSPGLLRRFHTLLDEAGVDYRMEISHTLEESCRYVEEAAAQGYEALWMGGGDGTINGVLNQDFPSHMHLGVVPMGTVNALARALKIPMNPVEACRFLLTAEPRQMNLGCVNGERVFLCFGSIGFDAAVVHDVGGAFKRVGGRLAYLVAGVVSVFSMKRLVPFTVSPGEGAVITDRFKRANELESSRAPASDGGYSLVVSNISNYAGFKLFPDAHPCADDMEMWLFRDRRLDAMAVWSAVTFLGLDKWKRYLRKNVGHYMVRSFVVESEAPMYLQLDGEAITCGDGRRFEFVFQENAVSVLAGRPAG